MNCDTLAEFQTFLDVQTQAIVDADLEAYLNTIAFPCRRKSLTHETLLEMPEQITVGFHAFAQNMKTLRVNAFVRLATSARVLGGRYIEGTHTSHLLSNGAPMLPPFKSRTVITKKDGAWRMVEVERNIKGHDWHENLLHQVGPCESDPVPAADDVRQHGTEAFEIYRRVLDTCWQALKTRQFEVFAAMHRLPSSETGVGHHRVISKPEDLRVTFDWMTDRLDGHFADDGDQNVLAAEFVSADMICGYHTLQLTKAGLATGQPAQSRFLLTWRNREWRISSVTLGVIMEPGAAPETDEVKSLMPATQIQAGVGNWRHL